MTTSRSASDALSSSCRLIARANGGAYRAALKMGRRRPQLCSFGDPFSHTGLASFAKYDMSGFQRRESLRHCSDGKADVVSAPGPIGDAARHRHLRGPASQGRAAPAGRSQAGGAARSLLRRSAPETIDAAVASANLGRQVRELERLRRWHALGELLLALDLGV